jgi:hypothetical protein
LNITFASDFFLSLAFATEHGEETEFEIQDKKKDL